LPNPAKRKQDRDYSVAGVGVGVGVGKTLSPGFAGVSRLCLPFSSCFGAGDGDAVDPAAGEVTGVVTAAGAAGAPAVALGEAEGLIGTILVGSSWCARDFFRPNVFGLSVEFSSPSFADTDGEIVAVGLAEMVGGLLGEAEGDDVDVGSGVIFRGAVLMGAAGVEDSGGEGDEVARGLGIRRGGIVTLGEGAGVSVARRVADGFGVEIGVADGASVVEGDAADAGVSARVARVAVAVAVTEGDALSAGAAVR
jgi:hypothetical protein